MKRLTTLLSGSEQFDAQMASFRLDVGKMIEKKEKQVNKQMDERLNLITKDLDGLNTSLSELRHSTNAIAQLKKDVKTLRDDDDRLTAMLPTTARFWMRSRSSTLKTRKPWQPWKLPASVKAKLSRN